MLPAALLIQDVQLLCFTVVFGVLALQRWSDPVRRWLWFSFLANTAGAVFDLLGSHWPAWLTKGINGAMIPLSYALLNISLIYFNGRGKKAGWVSVLTLAAGLPFLIAWRNSPNRIHSDALGDLLIALECIVTSALLLGHRERSTRAPRLLMGIFLIYFVLVELARVWIAFPMHGDPDMSTPWLGIVSTVTYILNVSLLPIAYIWMMQGRLEWELLQQSLMDPLTGVLNRRGLEQALQRELARCHRYGENLTVAMFDLDHFKAMNDQYGHVAGDAILVGVAQFLAKRLRKTDIVGRFGGEEFILLFPHTDFEQSAPLLEELCRSLRENTELYSSAAVRVTASFGVTGTKKRGSIRADELLSEADTALYQAKRNGRDQVCYFS
ncbi:MAG TPA: GGDEF domain-containing protein [Alloacidobacterium sp.]|nr:GGDEF domain-containing protein [Alloacidobacterium sp.]